MLWLIKVILGIIICLVLIGIYQDYDRARDACHDKGGYYSITSNECKGTTK